MHRARDTENKKPAACRRGILKNGFAKMITVRALEIASNLTARHDDEIDAAADRSLCSRSSWIPQCRLDMRWKDSMSNFAKFWGGILTELIRIRSELFKNF